jgi:anti-sigma regulatory factor (Ser/Thr protein kinase)
MSARIVLSPESASVPEARRFISDQLADLDPETIDVARLLVSEVVTNAVLHARTEVTLTLERDRSTVQVQIQDANPLLPVMRSHGPDAGTGRGLHVLDRLATRWGTSQIEGGKIVWFEMSTTPDASAADSPDAAQTSKVEDLVATINRDGDAMEEATEGQVEASALSDLGRGDSGRGDSGRGDSGRGDSHDENDQTEDSVRCRWVALPLAQLDLTAEHYDAVLREFHLVLEREPTARASVPGRLIAIMDELTMYSPLISSVEQDLERARQSGATSIDVGFDLPSEVGSLALRLDNLLDETDAYCAAGVELLSLEPPSEVVTMRKWLIGELVRQAEGHPAVAWPDSPWSTSFPRHRGDRV